MAGVFAYKLKHGIIVITGGTLLFSAHAVYDGNPKFYRNWVMPATRLVGAETAHGLAITLSKYGLVPRQKKLDPPILKTTVFGREFNNPVGLAAGFDKQGEAVDSMLKMGYGFVEVGSVIPKPQEGNPKPRMFRLTEDQGVINRMGFNSDGHEAVYQRLKARADRIQGKGGTVQAWPDDRNLLNETFFYGGNREYFDGSPHIEPALGVMGVNLGKNKTSPDAVEDYVEGVRKFGELADYLVINVSSPNTPGLRDMQGRKQLEELVTKVVEARNLLKCDPKPPLLVKIAPDLTEKDKTDIAAVVARPKSGVDGLIVSNTTIARPDTLRSKNKVETGGLSGQPLKKMSTQTISDMYRLTQGRLPIIGVGGVGSGDDAYEKIRAGASLVQLYSAMAYEGPPVVQRIKSELGANLTKDGFSSVKGAVGADHK
ncbi:dihydroorotate dehydrogenase (quinone), mitochondrial-like isoform X1 [Lineus longissimus]|uniref:dihydroorotate dehydrogenase (quinone), mitochondrial-like isoform X1 n=1 Tax=Lineus longissimus TaxID=88925 RepID=UPI002B4D415C